MKNIITICFIFITFISFSQTKKDSIPYLITKGAATSVLSLIPIVSGVGVIIDGETPKMKTQSYVFFGVGALINLDAVFTFRRAKNLSKHKM